METTTMRFPRHLLRTVLAAAGLLAAARAAGQPAPPLASAFVNPPPEKRFGYVSHPCYPKPKEPLQASGLHGPASIKVAR